MSEWVDFRALKQSLSIEQVLADYRVRLKRVGGEYLRGRCPLPTHCSEQSRDSFGVDLRKNVWACHSASCCKARWGKVGGTILDLVACMEGCSLREAGQRLQARSRPERSGFSDPLVSKRKSMDAATELPRLHFYLRLSGWHPYLQQRGIERQTADRFGIGYYAGQGFLHGRVVFPIHDGCGELVAYAGRAVDSSEPRYLFPPAFRKSQVVFNLHRAVQEGVRQAGQAIVVEGFFDCLKVHQAGYGNVVALLGVSLSKEQSHLLETHFRELILMLDGDEAGRRASRRLAARLREKISLAVVEVPSGRQPDQLSSQEIERLLRGVNSAPGA